MTAGVACPLAEHSRGALAVLTCTVLVLCCTVTHNQRFFLLCPGGTHPHSRLKKRGGRAFRGHQRNDVPFDSGGRVAYPCWMRICRHTRRQMLAYVSEFSALAFPLTHAHVPRERVRSLHGEWAHGGYSEECGTGKQLPRV